MIARCLIGLFLVLSSTILGAQKHYEKDYPDAIAQILGGEREVSVYGGSVFVTETHAYEVE